MVIALAPASALLAQEHGAVPLGQLVRDLGVNTRVLVIGAHPDDEDTFLIAWLSRGRGVETSYLSLTRGDGGQNLIGNELGEALGVIRTEELLAARRIDGARQYFSRAFDFGFSKDTIDTYRHWQRDSILSDVVRVVRAVRPQVIVAVFSGTPRDGHGHHQVSGLLARTAYDVAGDTVKYPAATFGPAWTVSKFYRAARFSPGQGTLSFDAGEYSPLLGRSYAEIAGESRSQHKSQGFGTLQRKGPLMDLVRREATRVNAQTPPTSEQSIFDGIDTTWARFRPVIADTRARAALDSLPRAFADVSTAFDAFVPARESVPLARVQRLLMAVQGSGADLESSLATARSRVAAALAEAAGLAVDVAAEREVNSVGTGEQVATALYNRGADSLLVQAPAEGVADHGALAPPRAIPPGGVLFDTVTVVTNSITQPWWLTRPRRGGMFALPASPVDEARLHVPYTIDFRITQPRTGASFTVSTPVIYRYADHVKGEIHRLVAGVPAIAVTLDQDVQYAPANTAIDRDVNVHLLSADPAPRDARVTLALPAGLRADSGTRTVHLGGAGARKTVTFHVHGTLAAGTHQFAALAESGGETFGTGYELVDYDHIRRERIYRPAETRISAVDVRVPAALRVAYVAGVSDNVAPMLEQLGIPVTVIAAEDAAHTDLSAFTAVVLGPRAYEAHPALAAANPRLFDFARHGGTVVVQYGQYEMARAGVMPYPVTYARPADRVTEEDAAVQVVDAGAKTLRAPNRIGPSDFAGWVQERALYMPHTFDPHYDAPLSMHDTGEAPNAGAILVAPLGRGAYVYTTLSLFRQLPAGVAGGARLFVNLLSAGLPESTLTP